MLRRMAKRTLRPPRSRRPHLQGRLGGLAVLVGTAALLFVGLAGCGGDADEGPGPAGGSERGAPPAASLPTLEEVKTPKGPVEGGPDAAFEAERVVASLLVSGGLLGKHKPCGCSQPQMGGVGRLARLLDMLRVRAEGRVTALVAGWSMRGNNEAQQEAKADFLRAIYQELRFGALLTGETDVRVDAMRQPYGTEGLDVPAPPLNLVPHPDDSMAPSPPVTTLKIGDLDVRAFSLLDPTNPKSEGLVDAGLARQVLPPLNALGFQKPAPETLTIVSVWPYEDPGGLIRDLAAKLRTMGPAVIIDCSGSFEGKERIEPRVIAPDMEPLVVRLEEKGKAAGVLDLVKTAEGKLALQYRMIRLVPALDDGDSELRDMVYSLLGTYLEDVRERDYLERFSVYPDLGGPKYVGSAACAKCHAAIFRDWNRTTSHAHALQTLEEIDYAEDPECVRCHVVGWKRDGQDDWYRHASGFQTAAKTPHLAGVGCENCHGPGSDHVADPSAHPLFHPEGPDAKSAWRSRCMTCHDIDNSPAFLGGFETYLNHVDHRKVPKAQRTEWSD